MSGRNLVIDNDVGIARALRSDAALLGSPLDSTRVETRYSEARVNGEVQAAKNIDNVIATKSFPLRACI